MITMENILGMLAIFGSFAGLLKYVFYLLDKHKEHINERFEVVGGRFKDHSEKIKINAADIKITGKLINKTREEIQRDFVRHDHLDKQMDELRETNRQIFERLDDISGGLNQLIGAHNGKVNSQQENDHD